LVIIFSKSFLELFLSILGMVTSIGLTIDSFNDNKAFGAYIDGTPNDVQQGTHFPDTIVGRGGNDIQYGHGGDDGFGCCSTDPTTGTSYPYGIYGDSVDVSGSSTVLDGGNDIQYGGEGQNELFGDAYNVYDSATVNGGNDIQYGIESGSTFVDINHMYGDVGSAGSFNVAQFYSTTDGSTTTIMVEGGDDKQTAQSLFGSTLYGDLRTGYSSNLALSSSFVEDTTATTTVIGGDDRQIAKGGVDSFNTLYGDVEDAGSGNSAYDSSSTIDSTTATTTVIGGDDTQKGGDGIDTIYGDVGTVYTSNYGSSTATTTINGGDDRQTGGNGEDYIVGDASTLTSTSVGGDDSQIGGTGTDIMFGDAVVMEIGSFGGNDKLNAAIGGKNGGEDQLYGDADLDYKDGTGGADHFIVGGNTNAKIWDYNPEEGDKISGALKKEYESTLTTSTSEQKQIEGQLNAILLKGSGKSK
jgi:hypothetical protein